MAASKDRVGACIAIGAAVGAASDNLGLWIGVGVAIGAALGLANEEGGRGSEEE